MRQQDAIRSETINGINASLAWVGAFVCTRNLVGSVCQPKTFIVTSGAPYNINTGVMTT
jgi:hypothetical protein